jgi:hypothetical protein
MSDWRQIQARIRKAKTSVDPLTKLSELYQRTRDAMVAWELGAVEEKGGRTEQAAKWYTTAAQRFRRAEWKKKAEEALARLGFEVPAASPESSVGAEGVSRAIENDSFERPAVSHVRDDYELQAPLALGEIPETQDDLERGANAREDFAPRGAEDSVSPLTIAEPGNATDRPEAHRKRRRGRRGGRGRHRKPAAGSPSLPAQAFTPPPPSAEAFTHRPDVSSKTSAVRPAAHAIPAESEERPGERREDRRRFEREETTLTSVRAEPAAPLLPSERSARGRAGDPALASRMAHLESMLRRLLSSSIHRLDEIDDAPAGPGVFLLSDSDQVTSYYVESCQTLRIGVGNLVRGNRGGKGRRPTGRGYSEGGDLKEKLADHLGINQSKVSQYMKDHCIVRWIQMDDDAPHLAHFAIGLLRTPLNLD